MFDLEISLIQGLEETSIVEVMVEWYSKMGVHDDSYESGMFSRGQE